MQTSITVFDKDFKNKLVLDIRENGDVKWDCSQKDIKKWPVKYKESYSKAIKFASKNSDMNKQEKLKKFFFARGIEEDNRLFQELFRGLKLNIGEEERIYIKETIRLASEYYGEEFGAFEYYLLKEESVV